MIIPAVAPVRPRIISPGFGETFLLEDFVTAAAETSVAGAIQLRGPQGSGKTTALCHLAATVAPDLQLVFLDDVDPREAAIQAKHRFVVYSSTVPATTGMTRKLATWTDDDFIEYLLACHRDQASSVFSRIRNAPDRSTVGGIPELWTAIIDEMSDEESIESIADAILRATEKAMPDRMAVEDLFEFCANALRIHDRGVMPSVLQFTQRFHSDQAANSLPKLDCLIRHRAVQTIVTADCVAKQLKADKPVALLAPITYALVTEIAVRVASDETAIDRLRRLADGILRSAPLAASILHACNSGWRPTKSRVNLAGARLSGVKWNGVRLVGAELEAADFSTSDLSFAHLQDANAKEARFEGATLEGAKIANSIFSKADLRNSNFFGAAGCAVIFTGADVRSAEFSKACLEGAIFVQVDLRDASFFAADLSGSIFAEAEIEGVDFRNARLHKIDIRGLPLRSAMLDGADFSRASLQHCDLEYVRLSGTSFRAANLQHAHLTGSTITDGDFRGADLRDAGLGEIDWEGADLRGAQLTGSSFHMGSTRSGLVGSPYPSEGTRTGFYTDDYDDQYFKSPEEIRKANLRGADLRGATIAGVDFYLVDLRDAKYDADQLRHLRRTGAILQSRKP